MNHREQTARITASNVPVVHYPLPRHLQRWRATAVVDQGDGHYVRVTAPGFTRDGAERRCRRAVVRELLRGWWS